MSKKRRPGRPSLGRFAKKQTLGASVSKPEEEAVKAAAEAAGVTLSEYMRQAALAKVAEQLGVSPEQVVEVIAVAELHQPRIKQLFALHRELLAAAHEGVKNAQHREGMTYGEMVNELRGALIDRLPALGQTVEQAVVPKCIYESDGLCLDAAETAIRALAEVFNIELSGDFESHVEWSRRMVAEFREEAQRRNLTPEQLRALVMRGGEDAAE